MGAPNLPFYSPDGFVEGMSVLTSENGRNVMAEAYDFRTVHGGDVFDIGPLHVTTYEMTHIGVNAVGYRIEAGGAVLAYTGDSGPCDEVIEMARDADLFVAEATYQDASSKAFFHMSATPGGGAREGGGGEAVDAHAHPADARPRGVPGRGRRRVRRRDRPRRGRHDD